MSETEHDESMDDQVSIRGDDRPDEPPGIRIARSKPPDVEPPLAGLEQELAAEEEAAGTKVPPGVGLMAEGKIPLDPLVVTPILRFEGQVLAELTKYKGWLYTQEEIDAIGGLIQQCGISASPSVQLIVCFLGLHMAKGGGWLMWRRTGKPESMHMYAEEAPGESG